MERYRYQRQVNKLKLKTNLFAIFPVTDLTKVKSYNIHFIQDYIHNYRSYLGIMLFHHLLLYILFRNMHVDFKKSYRCWPVSGGSPYKIRSVISVELFIVVFIDMFVLKLSRSFL